MPPSPRIKEQDKHSHLLRASQMAPGVVVVLLLLILPSLGAARTSSAPGGRIPALIVFGDSTVDSGNNNQINTVLRSNFLPYGRDFPGGRPTGRFCNGRLSTDFISEMLGLPPIVPAYLDPDYSIEDFAKGVCFASAGTGLDNATSDVLGVIPLWKEVEYFKEYKQRLEGHVGSARANHIVREAIYIVSIGTNDFLENYFTHMTRRRKQFTVREYVDFLVGLAADFITDIHRLGARKISFAGLAAIGCLPLERTTNIFHGGKCLEKQNQAAREFNTKLQAMIEKLRASSPGLKLRYDPVYDGFLKLLQNPSAYGIENVREGCCASGKFEMGYLCNEWNPLTCRDADKFAFWDAFHPTEKVNRLMAESTVKNCLTEFL